MKYRYLILCFLSIPFLMRAQGFEVFFGDSTATVDDGTIKVLQVPNEDAYLAVSSSYDDQVGNLGFTITKLDNLGNILWEKQHSSSDGISTIEYADLPNGFLLAYAVFGGINNDHLDIKEFNFEGELVNEASYETSLFDNLENITLLPDHSVVCIVQDYLTSSTHLVKVSQDGNLVWTKSHPFSVINGSSCFALESTPDGELLVLGKISDPTPVNVAIKFDQTGNLLWQTLLPIGLSLETHIMPFPVGDAYFIWGENDDAASFNTYITKVSKDGQWVWSQNFTSHATLVESKGVLPGEGNTLYISGAVYDGNQAKIALIQIDDNANVLWEKRYHEFDLNNAGQLVRDSDGGFFIAAETYPGGGQGFSTDPYLLKTDANGELIWDWYAARPDSYFQLDAILTSDGGYLIGGSSQALFDQGYQNYVIKLDSNQVTEPVSVKNGLNDTSQLLIYPQPAKEVLTFELKKSAASAPLTCHLEILNLLGQALYYQPIKEGTNTVYNLPEGYHFYRLWINGAVVETGKVVVVK